MNTETENILIEQIAKLPKEVVTFVSSSNWDTDLDEIGSLYNLSREELPAFKREVTLVLAGLTHPDEFKEVLSQEVGIQGAVLDAIVKSVEDKIFASIRPSLVHFLETENERNSVPVTPEEPLLAPIQNEPTITGTNLSEIKQSTEPLVVKKVVSAEELAPTARMWERISGAAPENLPIHEEAMPLIPPLSQKNPSLGDESLPSHPFEEKMKQVFTGAQQSMSDFALEPATPKRSPQEESKTSSTYHADPYREPIE